MRGRGLEDAFRFEPRQPASALPDSLGVPDVHWISLRPEMEGLIVPSKFYGVAAAGRPTIAVADRGGELAGLVGRHRCGLAVAPGDGDGFAEAILALRRDEAWRLELGRNARTLLDRRLQRARAFAQWRDSFDRVAAAQPVGQKPRDLWAAGPMPRGTLH